MQVLHAKGKIQQNEFIRYHFVHERMKLISVFVFLVVSIGLVINIGDPYEGPLIAFGFFFMYVLVTVSATFFSFYLRAYREYRSNPLFDYEQQFMVDHEGITQKSSQGHQHISWSRIIRAHHYKKMFILYVSKHQALVIPTHFFTSPEDQRIMTRFLDEKLQASQKGKNLKSS